MKKVLSLFWLLCLSVALVGCVNNSTATVQKSTNDEQPVSVEQPEEQKEDSQQIKAGEKIVTDAMEVTINSVKLTYDVLPDDTSGFYTHYEADKGKVYISVDADVTNKAKQNLGCDEIGTIIANYNDGYTYRGFVVVKDSTTGFTYANITSVDPLETRGIKWLIECPQEVETSTNPLYLEISIEGQKFKYTVR